MKSLILTIFCSLLWLSVPFNLSAQDLLTAAQEGNLIKLKEWVEKDSRLVHLKDENGRTPLHLACRGVHFELIQYLCEKGADVNALDNNQIAPLHSIAARNHLQAATWLVEKGAHVDVLNYNKETPLHLAVGYGSKEVAEFLVKKGANLGLRNQRGRTPLLVCVREHGGPLITRILIAAGADVNARSDSGETPLELAAWRGYREVVDILLENGASLKYDPNKTREILSYALSKGLDNLFFRLIKAGVEIKPYGDDQVGTVMATATGGSVPIMKQLLEKGLSLEQRDRNGWTPLHYAAEMDRVQMVEFLVMKGVDLNARTVMGQTPYNIAAENKSASVATFLAAKGADQGAPRFPVLNGPYLGQEPPGTKPVIFAPGIVSGRYNFHSAAIFSPDGKELMWCLQIPPRDSGYSSGLTLVSRWMDGKWSYPREAVYKIRSSAIAVDDVPCYLPTGDKLFDISARNLPDGSESGKENIWVWQKSGDQWINPQPVDQTINKFTLHWQFSVDATANIYLSTAVPGGKGKGDIYVSRYVNVQYQALKNLGESINTSEDEGFPFINPQGDYLVFIRNGDILVSFKSKEGDWCPAKVLNSEINTSQSEILPVVSPDGHYLFFHRDGNIYWVSARVIEELRPDKNGN